MVSQNIKSKEEAILAKFKGQVWRLNNLYYCLDEDGQQFLFKMNDVQQELYREMHYNNIVPKSRQHGVTTFFALFFLDCCLFQKDKSAGIIAHRLNDAQKILRTKIKYAYEHLPEELRELVRVTKSNESTYELSNGCSIYVDTSMRSGTLQYLHISEYGKLCARMPAKAQEVKTGAIETVHEGNMVNIESTSEGPFGDFFDMVEIAKKTKYSGREHGPMDYKLFFFPWFRKESNKTDPKYVEIPDKINEYLNGVEKINNIKLELSQRAWYAVKKESLKHNMYKEHPSTLEEAFISAVEGAYYAAELAQAREEGRICVVRHWDDYPVHTVCDLGFGEEMAFLFFQDINHDIRIIDSYHASRQGMKHYVRMLEDKRKTHGYHYGSHFAPHDIAKGELGTGETLLETAYQMGLEFVTIPREKLVRDGIERVTNLFPRLYIDVEKCEYALKAFAAYQRIWYEQHGDYSDIPVHNWASHFADSLRYVSDVVKRGLHSESGSMTREDIDRLNASTMRYTNVGT